MTLTLYYFHRSRRNRSLVSNLCAKWIDHRRREKSSLAHAARLCTEQINWSTPTATYHSHLHKRVRSPRSRFLRQFRYYLSTRHGSLNSPQFHTTPSGRDRTRPIEKTGPAFRRALVMCASAMKCKQAQYYSLFVGFTRTGAFAGCWEPGLNAAARDGSICSTTRKRPRRN